MSDLNAYTTNELLDMLPKAGSMIIEDHEDVAFQLEKTSDGTYRCWVHCESTNARVCSMTQGRVDPDFTAGYPGEALRRMLAWLRECGYYKPD